MVGITENMYIMKFKGNISNTEILTSLLFCVLRDGVGCSKWGALGLFVWTRHWYEHACW